MFLLLQACSGNDSKPNTTSLKNGDEAQEISLPDTEGVIQTLSSQKGNYILVDFWASWCRPCRRVNPQLVMLHEKYKDKDIVAGSGFEVWSVSLDTDRDSWLTAIRDDKLGQLVNLSDLKGASSPASRAYDVQAIPSSFLIDPEGKIIGINLEPRELDNLLANLMEQR